MEKTERFFDFYIKNNRLFPKINWKMSFYFYQTHWLPVEIYEDVFKKSLREMPFKTFLKMVLDDLRLWNMEKWLDIKIDIQEIMPLLSLKK